VSTRFFSYQPLAIRAAHFKILDLILEKSKRKTFGLLIVFNRKSSRIRILLALIKMGLDIVKIVKFQCVIHVSVKSGLHNVANCIVSGNIDVGKRSYFKVLSNHPNVRVVTLEMFLVSLQVDCTCDCI
jgi:hypothetical protein